MKMQDLSCVTVMTDIAKDLFKTTEKSREKQRIIHENARFELRDRNDRYRKGLI